MSGADHAPGPVAGDPAGKPRCVFGDHVALELPVLAQPPAALDEALGPVTGDLLGLLGALGVHRLLGLAQPLAPVTTGPQPLGQLVAARLPEQLVLGRVDPCGLLEDLLGDLLVGRGCVMRRGRRDLRPVDRDDPDIDHPGAGAELQHPAEQAGDRRLVTRAKPRDRRMIRRLIRRDHPKRDIVAAAPLDPPRRAHPDRVGVDETGRPSSPDRAPPDHDHPADTTP